MPISLSDRGMLCIDWDERSLRVLEITAKRGNVRIRKAVQAALPEDLNMRDASAVGEFIRRTLREHRIRVRRATMDIPRQDAVLNMLTLPKGSNDELAAMVHMQISRELPFNKDQAVIDFAIADKDASDGSYNVWVTAVRNHVMEYFQQVIAAANLKLERVGLRPYANRAAVAAWESFAGRTVTVDVGPSMTEINVIRDGQLAFSRAASVSIVEHSQEEEPAQPTAEQQAEGTIPLADDFAVKPKPMEALLIEVSRTMQAYRATEPGAEIDRIVLSGSGGIEERVREAFERRFKTRTLIYDAPEDLRWSRMTDLSAAPFSAAIGLALSSVSEEAAHFDFLHPKEPEAGRRERAKRRPILAASVVLMLIAGGVWAYQPIANRQGQLEELKKQVEELEGGEGKAGKVVRKKRKAFMKRFEALQEWQKENLVWVDQLARLMDAMPSNEQAYLTSIDCNTGGRITLNLSVKDRTTSPKIVESIRKMTRTVEKKGKDKEVQAFDAVVGDPAIEEDDPEYSVDDTIRVQVK